MSHRNAPAKINLGLHVLRRRGDGYHDIETVFIRIPWADLLRAEAADTLRLTCTDASLPVDERNLVIQAARRLDVRRGAHLVLEKHLPAGAGLGGGSSDAAATLLLLNEVWDLGRSNEELHEIAAQLGSDVPFFVDDGTAALGMGRGERLEPLLDPDTDEPYVLPYPLVVVVPPVHVSTAEAYQLVEPDADDRPDLAELVLSNDLERWREELINDFQGPLLTRFPAVAETKTALEHAGAAYTSLSGSGSAVFGVFEDAAQAEAAAEALRQTGHRTWHGTV
ncbi:MAG: 4-(cytidine 5'-diphospho)-2-C-methyl-D-erythritol kinase [Rhodothermales bacterium]